MTTEELMLFRIACACWVSEESHSSFLTNIVIGNRRRALFCRAVSVVTFDRAIREVDGQSVRNSK